ncbi:hypothetical protein BCR35DRAFT_127885 [Leucosporidium creatinivorum]|uniref:Uncharacterized protein n=1 Tax=Leucosporidium creatinivorum TaxID=106004 RepID=A0A1Y2EVY7_9BASI|nr:hypothetical protein BCR35DRAFT_127885 [Leucosporidium creatinivorum]
MPQQALSSLASTASSLGFPLDSSDPSTLNTLLSYHIVPRPIEPSDMYEDVPTIVETELTDPRWVQLREFDEPREKVARRWLEGGES